MSCRCITSTNPSDPGPPRSYPPLALVKGLGIALRAIPIVLSPGRGEYFFWVCHARLRARVRHPLEEMSFDSPSAASAIEMILGRMASGSNLEYGKRSKTPRQRGRARPNGERTDPCNSETVSSHPPASCKVKSPIPALHFVKCMGIALQAIPAICIPGGEGEIIGMIPGHIPRPLPEGRTPSTGGTVT